MSLLEQIICEKIITTLFMSLIMPLFAYFWYLIIKSVTSKDTCKYELKILDTIVIFFCSFLFCYIYSQYCVFQACYFFVTMSYATFSMSLFSLFIFFSFISESLIFINWSAFFTLFCIMYEFHSCQLLFCCPLFL